MCAFIVSKNSSILLIYIDCGLQSCISNRTMFHPVVLPRTATFFRASSLTVHVWQWNREPRLGRPHQPAQQARSHIQHERRQHEQQEQGASGPAAPPEPGSGQVSGHMVGVKRSATHGNSTTRQSSSQGLRLTYFRTVFSLNMLHVTKSVFVDRIRRFRLESNRGLFSSYFSFFTKHVSDISKSKTLLQPLILEVLVSNTIIALGWGLLLLYCKK